MIRIKFRFSHFLGIVMGQLHTKFETNPTISFGEEDFRNVLAKWPLAKTLKYASLERKHCIHTICILLPLIWAMHLDHYLKTPGAVLEVLS